MGFRAHTFSSYIMLIVPEAHAVYFNIVYRDIALWVSSSCVLRSGLPLLLPLPQLVRCSTP